MQKCLIYDNSLRFSRAFYGILVLVAFLIRNHWLILAVSLLMIIGAFSIKFNIPYQFHALVLRKILKERSEPIPKESGELAFACRMGGSFLLVGFLLLYFGKLVAFAWILILIVALLMLLTSFTGICVASLIYAVFKRSLFKK